MLKWVRGLAVVTGDPLQGLAVPVLLIFNFAFNVIANASFRLSALGGSWPTFLGWQVAGNLAGFITVITLTWLLRYHPLHLVFPVTTGLAVLGVQVLAAAAFFHEPIGARQWLGTVVIVLGILLVGGRS